ncbi:MAG: fibronectin type III domain-containing protein, partial [Desulfatitalea sp.]|nr:fibronectin type III domain-containing protein [Desulfatitalea sp.]
FSFESPEPRDVQRLKAAYPQGVYTFDGITADGEPYHSTSALNHALPATVAFIRPKADARAVGTHDVQIAWTPVKHLAAYIIEIQHAALGVELTAKLPAPASTFAVPNGYLLPGEQYQLSIGTISKEGNISFVETTFTTAENAK